MKSTHAPVAGGKIDAALTSSTPSPPPGSQEGQLLNLMLQLQVDILEMWAEQLRIAVSAANDISQAPQRLLMPDTESIGWSSRACS